MNESTLEKSLMNVNCVAGVLLWQTAYECIKEVTLEKNLISVNGAASVLD